MTPTHAQHTPSLTHTRTSLTSQPPPRIPTWGSVGWCPPTPLPNLEDPPFPPQSCSQGTARCIWFECPIPAAQHPATFRVRARVWNSTFIEVSAAGGWGGGILGWGVEMGGQPHPCIPMVPPSPGVPQLRPGEGGRHRHAVPPHPHPHHQHEEPHGAGEQRDGWGCGVGGTAGAAFPPPHPLIPSSPLLSPPVLSGCGLGADGGAAPAGRAVVGVGGGGGGAAAAGADHRAAVEGETGEWGGGWGLGGDGRTPPPPNLLLQKERAQS